MPARPSGDERWPPRRRRRGPRSFAAFQRRSLRPFFTSPPLAGACGFESQAAPLVGAPVSVSDQQMPCTVFDPSQVNVHTSLHVFSKPSNSNDDTNDNTTQQPTPQPIQVDNVTYSQKLVIWSVNTRKLLKNKAELEARLKNAGVDVLVIQETWLSDSVEAVMIAGFYLVGRRDRLLGPKRGYGGVAVFASNSMSSIALSHYSESAERMWCTLHTNIGDLLLANWYRPPDDDGTCIDTFVEEINNMRGGVVGVIVLGDLNIHHARWLKHSNANTTLGERLWNACLDMGLKQLVKQPTRKEYLLDLVISDVCELIDVKVLPELTDHRIVCVSLEVNVPIFPPVPREVWDFKRANWKDLKKEIASESWNKFLQSDDPDASSSRFLDRFADLCARYVPKKTISIRASQHPWLDDNCYSAIAAKCNNTTKSDCERLSKECAATLRAAFVRYQDDLRQRIQELPKSSKEWWKLNRELLNRKTKVNTIAPLKDKDGIWVLDPVGKANLLAATFADKGKLPPATEGPRLHKEPPASMAEFCLVRSHWLLRILKGLKDGKASGPDGVPTRIFKECAKELAPALAALVRFLLKTRTWPSRWRHHRIHPLFKKGAVSKPGNYRGVHLTDVVSKIVERAISIVISPFLDRTGAYGMDQWAFRKGRSCRDLVALLVCRWLWSLDMGFKVGIYLSDIMGAFDRVDSMPLLFHFARRLCQMPWCSTPIGCGLGTF